MGRKKKKVIKPWCWYCNRDFEDEKVLMQHQKAKHFKCHICYKKLYSGPGIAVHCQTVHKETIDKIPNSLPGRGSTEIEIYGMEGIPEADVKKHEAEVLGKSVEEEPADKRARTDFAPVMMPGFMPPMMPHMMGRPAMMPGMPPMPYAPVVPGMPQMMPGVPPMMPVAPMPSMHVPSFPLRPPQPSTIASTGVVTGVSDSPPAPPAPYNGSSLTPSAPVPAVPTKAVALVMQTTGTKIMHPDEDISLEERRASFPKYGGTWSTTSKFAAGIGAGSTGTVNSTPVGAMPAPGPVPGVPMPAYSSMGSMPSYSQQPMYMSGMPAYGYPPNPGAYGQQQSTSTPSGPPVPRTPGYRY